MLRLFAAARGPSEDPRADLDPLSPVIDVLDRAHRDLEAHELAAVLVEVDRLAAVLGAHPSQPAGIARSFKASHPAPATQERQAYRRVAASTVCECLAGPIPTCELDRLGARLEEYVQEVAVRPAGCGIPA